MKTKRPNTPDASVTKMDMTEMDKMKAPPSVKVYDRFRLTYQFCEQSVPHPSPQESDRTDADWTGEHTKTHKPAGETNLLSDWDLPSPQYTPNSKPEGIDRINIDKLSLDHDNPQEELIQVTNSLILPPTTEEKTTAQEKTDVDTSNQQEEEEHKLQQKNCVGQLSNEESYTSSDYSGFSY